MMTTKPRVIYKYRSFNNINYVMDILKNHRLYFPTRDKLNDPLEGMCQPLYFTYIGIDYYTNNGIEQPESKQYFDQFRVLSFSRHWNSMQMWAHYAQNYNGLCIGFNVKDYLCDIKEVHYTYKGSLFNDSQFEEDELTEEKQYNLINSSNIYKRNQRKVLSNKDKIFINYFEQDNINDIRNIKNKKKVIKNRIKNNKDINYIDMESKNQFFDSKRNKFDNE